MSKPPIRPLPAPVPAPPIDPKIVIEVARAIRAEPKLWQIIQNLKPTDWLSKKNAAALRSFVQSYLEEHYANNAYVGGHPVGLLRRLSEGAISSLDDTDELIAILLKHGELR